MTQYETRDYDLVILILLVVFCWPAAIIYYFTRPTVIRYQTSPQYSQPYQTSPPPSRYCPQCGTGITDPNARYCPKCGKQLT